jgi:homocysteine S-methyltransferase
MRHPQELINRFKSRVHVLDGGLATELEKRGHDINGKLWSAHVLLKDPGAIEQLHYDYLRSGADIIITSSYQLTFLGMQEAGYSHEQAVQALRQSVDLAVRARERFVREQPGADPLIAASIGPYGAYLADGSEYRGGYKLGVPQLIDFHRERFELLADSAADLIAFETIPCVDEALAYAALLAQRPDVAAWVSFSARDPQVTWQDEPIANAATELEKLPNVIAIGANCTAPRVIKPLVEQIRYRTKKLKVVYPNSGEGWDAKQRRWKGERDPGHFAEHARDWLKAGANIVGGCCRTGPEHIAQLRALVDSVSPER